MGNLKQMYQHKIITMEINIRLKKRTEENGRKHINFDIEELRENPQKLRMAETEEQRKQIINRITESKTEHQQKGQDKGHQIWNSLIKELRETKTRIPFKRGKEKKRNGQTEEEIQKEYELMVKKAKIQREMRREITNLTEHYEKGICKKSIEGRRREIIRRKEKKGRKRMEKGGQNNLCKKMQSAEQSI